MWRCFTRVHFKPIDHLASLVNEFSAPRICLVTDLNIRTQTTVFHDVLNILESQKEKVLVWSDTSPNPRTTEAYKLGEFLREESVDLVISLGGGSVIDIAKAGAMLRNNPGNIDNYIGKNRFLGAPCPHICLPTTCGTGSEVTWVSVLTDLEKKRKISIKGDSMFPTHCLLNEKLIETLPSHLIASTGMDALTHALEAYVCNCGNPLSDQLAIDATRKIFDNIENAVAGDIEARNEMLFASTTAGLAFGNADVGAVHCLSESIGGIYDLPHGLLNASLLNTTLDYHAPVIDGKMQRLVKEIWPQAPSTRIANWEFFLGKLEVLSRSVKIPQFGSLGISEEAFPLIATESVINGSNASNPQPMAEHDYINILRSASLMSTST